MVLRKSYRQIGLRIGRIFVLNIILQKATSRKYFGYSDISVTKRFGSRQSFFFISNPYSTLHPASCLFARLFPCCLLNNIARIEDWWSDCFIILTHARLTEQYVGIARASTFVPYRTCFSTVGTYSYGRYGTSTVLVRTYVRVCTVRTSTS